MRPQVGQFWSRGDSFVWQDWQYMALHPHPDRNGSGFARGNRPTGPSGLALDRSLTEPPDSWGNTHAGQSFAAPEAGIRALTLPDGRVLSLSWGPEDVRETPWPATALTVP